MAHPASTSLTERNAYLRYIDKLTGPLDAALHQLRLHQIVTLDQDPDTQCRVVDLMTATARCRAVMLRSLLTRYPAFGGTR